MNLKLDSKFTPYLICGLASFFYVYDYFIQVSPAIMTHQLMQTFQISAAGLGILGSVFFYAYAGMQIPAGMLLDRYQAKWLLTIAVLISGCGVLLFGVTSNFTFAAIARFLVGFGSAFSFVSSIYLVAQWFDHKQFALIAGLIQFAGCLGSIFGEAPLAYTVNTFGWRQTLIAIAIATFILSISFWLIIRERNPKKPLYTKEFFGISFLKVFKIPEVCWIAIAGFMCWIPVATIGALWGVPYLMKIFAWSNTKAAGFCSLFWLSLGISSPIIGWLSDRLKRRKTPFYICFFLGTIGSLLLLFAKAMPASMTALALILLGLAPGIQSLTFGVAKDILPKHIFGTVSGILNMAAVVGGGLAQVIMGFMLAGFWNHQMADGVPVYSVQDYQFAMLLVPISLIIGFIVTHYFIPETYCEVKEKVIYQNHLNF